MAAGPAIFGIPLKYISLITLCIQNSTLVIVMRYSRVIEDKDGQYYTSTAVFLSELTKLIVCIYMVISTQITETGQWSLVELYNQVFAPDAWKLMIPAALYTIQNNLQYVAVSMLDAATFQVTYQLKILTTALCSVIMLKTSLSSVKWLSLFLLTVGVALVQMPKSKSVEENAIDEDADMERIVGLGAVSVACVISGIAGVYFEKVLKGSQASVWIRNVQLSFFSLFPALILGVWWKDGTEVTSTFVFGATFVLIATYMYSKPDVPKKDYVAVGSQLKSEEDDCDYSTDDKVEMDIIDENNQTKGNPVRIHVENK